MIQYCFFAECSQLEKKIKYLYVEAPIEPPRYVHIIPQDVSFEYVFVKLALKLPTYINPIISTDLGYGIFLFLWL
jgi:hypothetical protein